MCVFELSSGADGGIWTLTAFQPLEPESSEMSHMTPHYSYVLYFTKKIGFKYIYV